MRHSKFRSALLVAALCATAVPGVSRAVTALGPEFQVNVATAGHQYRNRMSMTPNGDFIVTWTAPAQDGDGFGIVARRFDDNGAPVGTELVVNSYTLGDQQFSAVSVNESGRFVVVWRSGSQDGDSGGVFARSFDQYGVAQGIELQVNTYTPGMQSAPDVAVGPAGGFFVVWESGNNQDGDKTGIFARRHNSSAVPQGTEFQVNVVTAGYQSAPRIAIVQPSDLIVLWSNAGSVVGRRLGQNGVVGAEFQVSETGGASMPALAPTGDGGFLGAWHAADGGFSGIFARRFELDGDPLTSQFQVNTYTVDTQAYPEVAGNGTDFVVAWGSSGQDGDNQGIFARRLQAGGPVGAELQINVRTLDAQSAPSIGMGSDGAFVVVWDSLAGLGNTDVLARRLTVLDLATLDVDGDGSTEVNDGLLVLRFLFGFTGATLVNGALDEDCNRCDAATIVTYLDGLDLVLDIDDDGELDALTDGLLVLRFLSGFTGTALTSGAVDDDCMRCGSPAIEQYLAPLV